MKFVFIFVILMNNANAELVDKIAGVINDEVYTLSFLTRIKNTINARKEVSPLIYSKENYSLAEILKIEQENFIIKDKLASQGMKVDDDSVEGRIQERERAVGLKRSDLLNFLESKGLSYSEYFELIRTTMEYNIFHGRIISPLVSITDQELKNLFYKKSPNKSLLSFKYTVVDFMIPKKDVDPDNLGSLSEKLSEYQRTGVQSDELTNMATSDLGNVSDEDLPKDISSILRETNESMFSKPIIKNDLIHIFYISKKVLDESEEFKLAQENLSNELFTIKSEIIKKSWFEKEFSNYYTQIEI